MNIGFSANMHEIIKKTKILGKNDKYYNDFIKYMQNDNKDRDRNSVHVNAGGDVIGMNVNGDKNIIGKNMNISQPSTKIQQININQQILSKLDENYFNAFKQVTESLNNQIKGSKDVKP